MRERESERDKAERGRVNGPCGAGHVCAKEPQLRMIYERSKLTWREESTRTVKGEGCTKMGKVTHPLYGDLLPIPEART